MTAMRFGDRVAVGAASAARPTAPATERASNREVHGPEGATRSGMANVAACSSSAPMATGAPKGRRRQADSHGAWQPFPHVDANGWAARTILKAAS
jgi:hypothetical protein